jgi:hypothetical protein
MDYQPPSHLLEVLQKIEYEEALSDQDPRYVDSQEARGSEKTFTRLARKFGWDPASNAFFAPYEKHFLIDGTDKMRGEYTQQFFVQDAEQLLAIKTLVIYTAPLHLKYDGRLGGKLDADIVLPMMKLYERDGGRFEAGWSTMRRLLLLRADRCLFASDAEVDRLVEFSGGHPRELLRLLKLCCELAEDRIDASVVQTAIEKLAADYRYFLKPADYALLKTIDSNPVDGGNDEQAQQLLHRLALLQYNDGTWLRSHPVVRTLEGYGAAGG